MRRSLFVLVFLVMLMSVVFGSAAALEVDGGTIQAFVQPVSIQEGGTSLEAAVTAAGFWLQDELGDHLGTSGEICVTNTGERPTASLTITAIVQAKQGWKKFEDYASQPVDTSGKPTLAPGEAHCYPYRIEFDPLPGAQYRSLALVTITNHSGWLPGSRHCTGPESCPFGPQPKVDFNLPAAPTDASSSPLGAASPMSGREPECSAARLVAGVDGSNLTTVPPGGTGIKRWSVKNTGRCAWDSRYRIAFLSGEGLEAPAVLLLLPEGEQVQPEGSTEAELAFRAPHSTGVFEGRFILIDPDDQVIPVEDSPEGILWLRVAVVADPSPTASPTHTPLPAPTETPTPGEEPASEQLQPPLITPTPAAVDLPTSAPTHPALSCTRPVDYWRQNSQAWPLDHLILGNINYSRSEVLAILEDQSQAAGMLLAQQLIAAKLNLAREPAIEAGDTWLVQHSMVGLLTIAEEKQGLRITGDLEDFNLGKTGPGMCKWTPETPATPAHTASSTPTPTLIPTSAPTEDLAATPTPQPSPAATIAPEQSATVANLPPAPETAAPSITAPATETPTAIPTATPIPTETPTLIPSATPTDTPTEAVQIEGLAEAGAPAASETPIP